MTDQPRESGKREQRLQDVIAAYPDAAGEAERQAKEQA